MRHDVPLELHACCDAQSVFSGITAENVKLPAERHTLYHAQWVRELLDASTLRALWWLDTRDCVADGLTKGCIDRAALVRAGYACRWLFEGADPVAPAIRASAAAA